MTSAAEVPAQAKHRLLAAAGDLFYAKGIHAVGVDAVVAASGVAKMTLYKHFGSKDALVAACLRKASEDWRAGFERSLARVAPAPASRLAAFFDVFAEWFADPSFRGCPLVNALCELPDAAHPARPIILEHRRLMLDLLTRLAWDAGVRDHQAVAKSLSLLADGAVVAAMAEGSPEPARHAAVAARAIINAAQK